VRFQLVGTKRGHGLERRGAGVGGRRVVRHRLFRNRLG
jgi:hypothetical protein